MKHSPLARITLVGLVLVGGAAAGCGSKDPVATTSSAVAASPTPASPTDTLLASVKTFGTTSYRFRATRTALSGGGTVDPVAKAASFTQNDEVPGHSISLGYTVIGTDLWMTIDLGATANKQLGVNKTTWMHIDQTKVTDKTQLPLDANGNLVIGTGDMFDGVTGVNRVDSTHFSGTVDVTNPASLLSPDKALLTKVGDKAKAVPFTATLDSQGRLTALTLDGATIDSGLTMDLTFDSFGAPVTITKPAGAIPPPATLYSTFFGG
jgi:hypothetical protein